MAREKKQPEPITPEVVINQFYALNLVDKIKIRDWVNENLEHERKKREEDLKALNPTIKS